MSWEWLWLGIFLGYAVGFIVDLAVTHRKLRDADRRIRELEAAKDRALGHATTGPQHRLEAELRTLRERNAQLEADRERLMGLVRSMEPLQAELARLRESSARLEESEDEAARLRSEVERLKTEPKSVPGTDELKMEVSRLWARLGSAEREREAMESELRGLRSSLALAESERDTWKTKAQSLEDQAADPTELSDALSRAVESADQWRQRAEDAQRLLAESVARHASEMAELRDRIQSLQAAEPAHGNEVLVAERNLALAERDRLQAQLVEAEARLRLAHASLRQAPAIWEARTHPEERHDEEERAIQATQNRPALSEAEEGQGRDSARAAQLESQLRQADRVIEDLRSQIARLEHALRQTRPSTGGFVAPGAGRLTAIPGLTQTAERRLAACGIGSLAQLAALDPDDPSVDPDLLTELPDLREWIERARRILEVGGP